MINDYSEVHLVPSAYYWMGKSALILNKEEDAINYFQTVINSSLNTEIGFSSVLELGKIYRNQKKYFTEIELYEGISAKNI